MGYTLNLIEQIIWPRYNSFRLKAFDKFESFFFLFGRTWQLLALFHFQFGNFQFKVVHKFGTFQLKRSQIWQFLVEILYRVI